jgi:hypothetical protein
MAHLIYILALIVVVSSATIEIAYVYATSVKKAHDAGLWIPREMLVIAYVMLVIGAPADVLFNWTRGSMMYRERPRWGEWTFSARVERIANDESHPKHAYAIDWAILLNHFHDGHIRYTS